MPGGLEIHIAADIFSEFIIGLLYIYRLPTAVGSELGQIWNRWMLFLQEVEWNNHGKIRPKYRLPARRHCRQIQKK